MQNQAAVEALYSATFVEDYLDTVENLPNELQRHLSSLRELDLVLHRVSYRNAYFDPLGLPTCPFVSTFQNLAKQNNFQVTIVGVTIGIVGLAGWIIDDTCLVFVANSATS